MDIASLLPLRNFFRKDLAREHGFRQASAKVALRFVEAQLAAHLDTMARLQFLEGAFRKSEGFTEWSQANPPARGVQKALEYFYQHFDGVNEPALRESWLSTGDTKFYSNVARPVRDLLKGHPWISEEDLMSAIMMGVGVTGKGGETIKVFQFAGKTAKKDCQAIVKGKKAPVFYTKNIRKLIWKRGKSILDTWKKEQEAEGASLRDEEPDLHGEVASVADLLSGPRWEEVLSQIVLDQNDVDSRVIWNWLFEDVWTHEKQNMVMRSWLAIASKGVFVSKSKIEMEKGIAPPGVVRPPRRQRNFWEMIAEQVLTRSNGKYDLSASQVSRIRNKAIERAQKAVEEGMPEKVIMAFERITDAMGIASETGFKSIRGSNEENLRKALIRLAHRKPETRRHLLPLLGLKLLCNFGKKP